MKPRVITTIVCAALLWQAYVVVSVILPSPHPDLGHMRLTDRDGLLIADLPGPDGLKIPLGEDESIPENIAKAFTTIEDERFFSHWGVDMFAKLRALRDNYSANKIVSGGSTITEQWIKTTFFPHASRTVLQKLREANLALYFTLLRSKEEVLRSYIDSIYFGQRNYGIKAAMKAYFGKSHLETVTDEELVTLLTIIRSPGVANPKEKFFQERWERIASQLKPLFVIPTAVEGSLTNSRVSDFSAESALSSSNGVEMTKGIPGRFAPYQGFNRFPHVTTSVRQELLSRGESPYLATIATTVDSTLQAKAEELINESLDRLANKHVTNGAAYVVDPRNGDILVWVGSRDFYSKTIDGQVNVIMQRRQMGSALKPFLYLYAFMNGAHPDQLTVDLEKDFDSSKDDETYRPLNYSLREGGVMPLKIALASSFNISAVRILEHLGLQNTYQFLKNLGLPFDHPAEHYGYSLALGSPDLPMQAVADAYGSLANGGVPVKSHLIRQSPVIASETKQSLGRLQNISSAFYLFDTLSNPLNRRRSFGVNSVLNTSIPFAVKTGTTKDFHDNWTFGYHPDLVVATWVGNNDNTPMIDVDGITGAGPIWHRLVEFAIEKGHVSAQPILPPPGLSQTKKCLDVDCRQTELIYQEPGLKWYSDLINGHYCLEDFYIKTIDPAEIAKVAKLFNFKDFTIEYCAVSGTPNPSSSPIPDSFSILSPKPNETFYIRPDVPLELQKIILRANQEAEWFLDDVRVGYGKNIFIQPVLGERKITAEIGGMRQSLTIEVIRTE
jgi:membrane peptidoglycan carboxypeptidase